MGTPQQADFLLHSVAALLAAKGARQFAEILSRQLAQRLRFSIAGLYLYNRAAHAFTPVSPISLDPAHEGYQIAQLPAAGTMKEAAIRSGIAVRCDDMADSQWAEGSVFKQARSPVSSVVAPLILRIEQTQPRPIAVMFAAAWSRAAFTENDCTLMMELADCAAPVLETVLTAQERDALRAITHRLVVGSFTLQSLVPAVEETLQQVIPHDMNGLVRFTQDRGAPWFEIVHQRGTSIDLTMLHQFPFERMAPAEMLATGRPLLITGHGHHERFPESRYIESLGILSAMLCPLIVRGQPYGFLALGSKRRNAFSERDLGLAEQVGHHLSQAISNLLAYGEIHALKEQLEQENVYLREEIVGSADLKQLVGGSAALQKTLKTIEQVAPTNSTVLITGETGTGKELVAQAIHQLSPRKEKAFIKVNCAALPPSLIESELFGHEKGAFTGAVARKIGRFELANGGTIFLDEIGEVPLNLQAKLLRVLEDRELERVGGQATLKLDVRLLAATNMDLDQAVKAGAFRADLYYRLKVFPIRIPALRERREDIPVLAKHFTKKYASQHRKPIARIASATLRALSAYAWPGNVRELEHLIERAVILSQGPVLAIDEFEQESLSGASEKTGSRPKTLAEAERIHILDVLHHTNWVLAGQHGAATKLGMKRSTLQHRMKKLGIKRPSSSQA